MKTIKDMSSLQGAYIFTTPLITDQLFEKAVVFLTEVQTTSAYGFFVDFILQNATMLDLIKNQIQFTMFQDEPIYLGGPIGTEQIFVLHSNDEICHSSYYANDTVLVTKLDDALVNFENKPKFCKILAGYCEWHVGQLEKEIRAGYWLSKNFSEELLFKEGFNKWNKCLKSVSLHPLSFSMISGIA